MAADLRFGVKKLKLVGFKLKFTINRLQGYRAVKTEGVGFRRWRLGLGWVIRPLRDVISTHGQNDHFLCIILIVLTPTPEAEQKHCSVFPQKRFWIIQAGLGSQHFRI